MRLKITSDRWWPEKQVQSGYLWHYGHFVHDLLMPLNDYFTTRSIDPTGWTLYLQATPDQSIGAFAPIVAAFFGAKVEEIDPSDFEALDVEHLPLRAYLFGPFHDATLKNMLATAVRRFNLSDHAAASKVILIERGAAKNGFEARDDLPAGVRASGIGRRSLINHDEIAEFMRARYGTHFQNVVLESMSFQEQVRVFWSARLVVGQHGAGLNNIVWMRAQNAGVTEIGHRTVHTFENLCATKGYRYAACESEAKGAMILSPNALEHALDQCDALAA